jgi:hypothetical protein
MDMWIKWSQELRQSNFLDVYQRQAEATFAFDRYVGLLSFVRGIYVQLCNLEVTLGLPTVSILGRRGSVSRLSYRHKRGCDPETLPVVLGTHLRN